MAISGTYLSLQLQIADELGQRTDLLNPLPGSELPTSPIQNAIQSAITFWEDEPFWFNEVYENPLFSTAIGQEYYSATTSPVAVAKFEQITKISKIRVLINSNRYVLNARTWQYIEDTSVNPSVQSEFPIDFAYFAGTMRFYPIPAEAIPVTLSDNERLPSLVNPDDSNAWTTDGFDLIRSQAKPILAQEVLFDDDLVQRMKTAIYGDPKSPWSEQQTHGYLYKLQAASTRRGAAGHIRPSYF